MKWYQMRWAQKYWGKDAAKRYQQYLQSDAWKEKRNAILKAAGYRCRKCGERATEVHHETYKRIYKEKLTDLTTLCRKCHETVHTAPKQNLKRKVHKKQDNIRITEKVNPDTNRNGLLEAANSLSVLNLYV